MPGTHPQNLDPRPKRRKDKDNPYEILSVGIGTAFPHYYLSRSLMPLTALNWRIFPT